MDKLKPITDLEREILSALGETPAEHQAKLQARMRGEILKQTIGKIDTRPDVHKLNQQFEKDRNATRYEHISTVVSRMKVEPAQRRIPSNLDEAMELGWTIEGYVFFQQHILCITCGYTEKSLDSTKMFAKLSSPRPYEAVVYIPTKNLPADDKPKLVEVKSVELSHCPMCWGFIPKEKQNAKT